MTIFFRGGLGNQMFQYALGLHLAKKNDASLILDTTFLSDRFPRREFTYRNFELTAFKLTPHLTRLSRLSQILPVPGAWLGLDLLALKSREIMRAHKVLRESGACFNPKILQEKGNLLLWGFWQSERYFCEIANEVRTAFQFRGTLQGEPARLAEEMSSCNSISLHVRRGDYVTMGRVRQQFGEDTNVAYYARAVDYMSQRVDNPRFFLFSDDIEWCKRNLPLPSSSVHASLRVAGAPATREMELMSLAKHNVIANSTFSWWGAWLNRNPSKIVVAPRHWYSSGIEEDIVADSWVRL